MDAHFRLSADGQGGRFMSADHLKRICASIAEFSGQAVISLSLTGEPSLHPGLPALVETILSFEGLRVLIETSGLGWAPHKVFEREWDPARFMLIISLDALDPSLYRTLRGEGFDEAVAFARQSLAKWPDSVWVQGVRMNENEEDLEKFFRHWKETTDNIIIQKYSTFAGLLPERKVTDLSPLDRFPCWALKREMAIGIDGDVYLCRNTPGREPFYGNVFFDSLENLWALGLKNWLAHASGEYAGPCAGCDDYYVYNF
jgi:spiro-SPASM protein